MKLLLSQKNQLFDAISNQGFSPTQFEYKEVTAKRTNAPQVVLVYRGLEDYRFTITDSEEYNCTHNVIYAPSNNTFENAVACMHWGVVMYHFIEWLQNLENEVGIEDKWAKLEEMAKEIDLVGEDDNNESFSVQEFRILEERMQGLKAAIPTLALTSPQIEILNNKLDRLIENAENMKKREWQNLFIGTIIAFAMEQALNQADVHALWQLIKQVFNGVLLLTTN